LFVFLHVRIIRKLAAIDLVDSFHSIVPT